MYKFLKNLSWLLCLLIVFGGCRKKAFDDFYNPPANLAPPIYQVLQARGNFTNLLACIDKSGYQHTLAAAGYWTFFAPNDAAFQKYFAANGTTLANIDSATAKKIVTYCLVYNAFQTTHIGDFQSPLGWVTNDAYKRKTAYYDGFYTGAGPDGANTTLISANRNANTAGVNFLFGDENNKYIPYFYSGFMTANNLGASDYNYFFPTTTYTGFNVVNSTVVNKDIIAQNGVIHEIDQVILPLPSVEQKLASNSQYSVFKGLYDQFMITYGVDANETNRYYTLTRKSNSVYVKQYSSLLAYAPGNENYLLLQNEDAQTNGYTMFAPTNAALTPYLNSVLLEFYKNVNSLPQQVVADFLNAHMFQTTVWPSKFASTTNFLGEPARFDPSSNVVDKQFCSNGIFYGTNQVEAANEFSTVYARALLDPAYSIMTRLLNIFLKNVVISPGLKFTVFMLPDATLQAAGFNFDSPSQSFTQTVNGTTTSGATPQANLQRILYQHVFLTPNNEMANLSGDGIEESYGGEYARWHNNTISSAGSVELNTPVQVLSSRTYSNGLVYFMAGTTYMTPAASLLATDIQKNAGTAAAPGPYYDFYTYLVSSAAYNPGATEINAVQLGGNYTIFIPTQAAMKQAVVDGFLPGTTTGTGAAKTWVSFNYNPSLSTDRDLVQRFINYHILNGITIAPDGKKGANGSGFPTLLKDSNGNNTNIITFNQPNNLVLTDMQGRQATVTAPNNASYFPATSNYLGNRTLLHQINNYLRYNY